MTRERPFKNKLVVGDAPKLYGVILDNHEFSNLRVGEMILDGENEIKTTSY